MHNIFNEKFEFEKKKKNMASKSNIFFKMLIISLRCACFVMDWKDWAFQHGEYITKVQIEKENERV